ncbi:polysaccharide deacetylase, partial [Lysinibacillus sp. NPDC056232]
MNDCAVMYHYVINKDFWKGSVPISPTDFEQQITLLKQKYDIVLPSELNNITEKPKCLLTFDDATKDQYINAFPILKKLNVKAYFAIMSGPLQDKRIPTVHLVHATLANYTDEEIWSSLQPYVSKIDFKLAEQYYHYENSILRRKIKYSLNMALDEQTARKFLLGKVKNKYGS